ncbi:hypothetical protein PQR75_12570 [Paraburkholderia fungorum]|uniref:hypothetical protein n=1 Tax=Paraburkholderia fungorum TaxID=134537 RepID=UPI0038BB63B7
MSRFLCLSFFAAAKKVSAAPHRGNTNRPISIQGKATATGKQPNPPPQANRQISIQGKATATGKQPNHRHRQTIQEKAKEPDQEKPNAIGKQTIKRRAGKKPIHVLRAKPSISQSLTRNIQALSTSL